VTAVLGIDIGGTGIKGAPVETTSGVLLADRHRILTPQPATPKAVAGVVAEVVDHFDWEGRIGCTFPGVVKGGVVLSAANVDKKWIGVDAAKLFGEEMGVPVRVINDADAAGLAEVRFGAGRDRRGVVLIITLGTGIGCGLFLDGKLVPNTELGHIEIDGKVAESQAADSARERKGLSWKQYAARVERYLQRLDALLWPDLIIIGGGASKRADKLLASIHIRPELVGAALLNEAGIVGAALVASD
jgi:polyphosphate glucokinase